MVRHINQLKQRFFSLLPPALSQWLGPVVDSTPFALVSLAMLLVPLAVVLLFSLIYIITFFYGIFSGAPLPSREIFLFFPALAGVFSQPATLAKAFLVYAILGLVLSRVLQRERQPEFGRRFLPVLDKHWNLVSFLVIFSLLFATLGKVYFSYSSEFWTLAVLLPYGSENWAIGGLLPYSDAAGHYFSYIKYFYNEFMSGSALRRPLAAFFGTSVHWFAGNDPTTALMLRCLLICCAMWASSAVMKKSFGVWSALGCIALEYTYICNYLHTFMTESLGFFWGCIAVTLWLQALREKRLFWDMAAYSVTLVGLLTRMGAMFLVPVLGLYILWRWRVLSPAHGWWKKPLLGLCICTAAIVLLNATCASRGAHDDHATGSNFSYTFAGLTLGTNWFGGLVQYQQELNGLNEKQRSWFLYKQGIKNILQSPEIFIGRLVQGEEEFLEHFNFFLFGKWYIVCLFGGLLVLRRKTLFSKVSSAFWFSVWAAILLSIPFIYYDDSWRVNIFVYPFIACFFSLALAHSHQTEVACGERSEAAVPWFAVSLSGVLLLIMTSMALFPRLLIPPQIEKILTYRDALPLSASNKVLVPSGGMSFLVVPDGEAPKTDVPSMTWSTFKDRYQKFARSATYRPLSSADLALLTEAFPKPPFGVLSQVTLSDKPPFYFITPENVITQKNVLLWDFETDGVVEDGSTTLRWQLVKKATPVVYK